MVPRTLWFWISWVSIFFLRPLSFSDTIRRISLSEKQRTTCYCCFIGPSSIANASLFWSWWYYLSWYQDQAAFWSHPRASSEPWSMLKPPLQSNLCMAQRDSICLFQIFSLALSTFVHFGDPLIRRCRLPQASCKCEICPWDRTSLLASLALGEIPRNKFVDRFCVLIEQWLLRLFKQRTLELPWPSDQHIFEFLIFLDRLVDATVATFLAIS